MQQRALCKSGCESEETTKNWMSQVLGFSEKLNRRKSIREVLKKRARVREREKSINRMLT